MNKGTNSAMMRQKNEKIILSLINKEPMPRAEIAKRTGLTKAAVTIITEELINRGYIVEKNVEVKSVGRNPVMLHINGDSVYNIGINITRTDVTVGITDICGNVISEECFNIDNPEMTFGNIKESLNGQILRIDTDKIYKCSVVTPGPVDTENGMILNPPNFSEWHNVNVVSEIGKLVNTDVVFGNVSSSIALAEKYFGSAKQSENFLALLVDTGVGSGIVTDNRLFKGRSEFGHISIDYNGKLCECGNRGCLERYASVPELLVGTEYKSWEEAVDREADEVIETEAKYLSTAILSASNVFSIDKAVICGELTYKPEKIISCISDMLSGSVFLSEDFEVMAGVVKSKTLVASALAVDCFFN